MERNYLSCKIIKESIEPRENNALFDSIKFILPDDDDSLEITQLTFYHKLVMNFYKKLKRYKSNLETFKIYIRFSSSIRP